MQGIPLEVFKEIMRLSNQKQPLLIAIDGRCAAGKTTLAGILQQQLGCNVIHMDHFFLQPHQRTPERLKEPGGNVDYERVYQEVILPIQRGEGVCYRPYDCQRQTLAEPISMKPHTIHIIEGSYSCHPFLAAHYDLTLFLHIDLEKQIARIRQRNGEAGALRFQEMWIPLEEAYFSAYSIPERCQYYLEIEEIV